jgi:hypothetical protein
MTEKEETALRAVYEQWPIERLIRAATHEKGDYEPTAVAVMLDELKKRGVSNEALTKLPAALSLPPPLKHDQCSDPSHRIKPILKTITLILPLIIAAIFLVYINRDDPSVNRFTAPIADLLREHIAHGSAERSVQIPHRQMKNISLDSWRVMKAEGRAYVIMTMHNQSDWIISSIDFKITSKTGASRTFRTFPTDKDGQQTAVGQNQSFIALSETGEFAAENSQGHIVRAFGYKE